MTSEKKQVELNIIAAAKKVFVAKGYDSATMRDIAKEAKVNSAMLHYYFRSKERLFELIFEDIFNSFYNQVLVVYKENLDFFEKIRKIVKNQISMLIEERGSSIMTFFIIEFNKHPELLIRRAKFAETIQETRACIVGQILDEVKKGRIIDIEPQDLLFNIDSLCAHPFYMRILYECEGKLSKEEFHRLMEKRQTEVAEFIIRGIQA